MNNLSTLWNNPHLRYSVGILLVIEVGMIWFPHFKEQLAETKDVVLMYALAAAANSAPTSK